MRGAKRDASFEPMSAVTNSATDVGSMRMPVSSALKPCTI